jgi:hypothetical protein
MSNRAQAFTGLAAGSAVRPVIPTDFDQAVCIAKLAIQAGLFQGESEEKALAQATMAVLQGLELGIPPMQAVQQIAVIGGRCTLWGDLIPALIWRAGHKIREWVEGEGDARIAWCEIIRGDNKEVIRRKFSVVDAKRAGLWDTRPKLKRKDSTNSWREDDNDNPWYRFDERMLQMRARGFCARDGAPDALHGLSIREEIEKQERWPTEVHNQAEAHDKEPVMGTGSLSPPPAPEEDLDAPAAPAKPAGRSAPQLEAETIRDPDDFLSDLDISLSACKTEDQLNEVWGENLDTVLSLGMQPRQKAELLYDRHRCRLIRQMDMPVKATEKNTGAAA